MFVFYLHFTFNQNQIKNCIPNRLLIASLINAKKFARKIDARIRKSFWLLNYARLFRGAHFETFCCHFSVHMVWGRDFIKFVNETFGCCRLLWPFVDLTFAQLLLEPLRTNARLRLKRSLCEFYIINFEAIKRETANESPSMRNRKQFRAKKKIKYNWTSSTSSESRLTNEM